MADLALVFGGDLGVGPGGDLALVSSSTLTEQRVLRRLLTNKGDYIWQLTYGAGLGQFVGQPGVTTTITGVVHGQLMQESRVSNMPAPQLTTAADQSGTVTVTLRYADAATNQTGALSLSI